ncbi:hypothetical protein Q3G72_025049 [Acer saccharum]|nr:hypothetical protein Q3G72_025049 [Acer saccharum]
MVKQRKQRKHGLRFPLFKRKNINNGSGDNNNNSNEGEKTKEMVLGHPPKLRLMRLNNFGNMVRTGADPMEPVGDSGNIERYSIDWQQQQQFQQQQQLLQQLLQLLQPLSPQQQQQLLQDLLQLQLLQLSQLSQQLQQRLQRLLLHLPQLQPQNWLPHLRFNEQQQLLQLLQRQKKLQTKVKAGGDGDSGSGSAGDGGGDSGDDGDDNDGGDRIEGGGGGKMGSKMEPNGRHDYRNRFSYHGGDENGYPVGQLHRCYYEKPNVCSIIPYQRKNINNGSGDNNNNSNEGEKTKEMVLGIPPNRGQIKLKTFGDMVRTGANPMEPVGESGNIKNYHIDQPSQQLQLQQQPSWQLLHQQKELQTKVKAGGDGDSVSDGVNGSGDDGGDNDSGHKTEGGGSGKMGTKMEPKGQHDNCNRFSCHGGDENGYPVGQLHRCNYQAAIAVAAMAAEMATAIMLVGIKLKAVAMEKWILKRSPRVNTMITLTDSHIMQGDENGGSAGDSGGDDGDDNDGGDKTEDGGVAVGKWVPKWSLMVDTITVTDSHVMVEMRMGIQLDSCIAAIMRNQMFVLSYHIRC